MNTEIQKFSVMNAERPASIMNEDQTEFHLGMWYLWNGKRFRKKIIIPKKLNKNWFLTIRSQINVYLSDFNWFDLRYLLFEPLKDRIMKDNDFMTEAKWEDFISNGNVYLTCEQEDEDGWFAPTLKNWWNGKELDF